MLLLLLRCSMCVCCQPGRAAEYSLAILDKGHFEARRESKPYAVNYDIPSISLCERWHHIAYTYVAASFVHLTHRCL